ncbi:tripartite tricarboxylate transporter TctB family protein [Salinarimonas sp. NSM]|uniref:tripartite tricarboxylate transporter TctB family protein n=1 Tax=Salinarimonas sp. NSM TaxID=3458003 RepID=UPI004036B100
MSDARLAALDRAGPVLIALVCAVFSVVYVAAAYLDSSRIHNVIFIIPMAAITGVLAGIVIVRAVLGRARAETPAEPSPSSEPKSEPKSEPAPEPGEAPALGPLGIAALMGLLIAYAFSIPWIGFDVASILFMATGLWILGERRPLFVAALSLAFGLGVTWLLLHGARVPAHTLLL